MMEKKIQSQRTQSHTKFIQNKIKLCVTLCNFVVLLFFLAYPSNAKLRIDISEPNLEISTGFTGDTLTLFGTVSQKGDIVILVKGPTSDTTIRRKVDVLGLWIHANAVEFKNVHGYYNVASSKQIANITSPETRTEYRMGINSLIYTTNDDATDEKKNRFLEALIQQKQLQGLYALTPNAAEYLNDTLFKTRITMPANVPLGDYEIEAFLFKNGQLIDQTSHPFTIKQVGLAAEVHDFAFEKPFLYGLSVILIAILSSFLAVLLLRRE